MNRISCTWLALLALAANLSRADTFGSGANSFEIEFVRIGSPGNSAGQHGPAPRPAGSVPYEYRIGKFEISEQKIDKANALGGLGITKDSRGPDKPATSVDWFEASAVRQLAQYFDRLSTCLQVRRDHESGIGPTHRRRSSCGSRATRVTTRRISFATVWQSISCRALMSGTRPRSSIRRVASISITPPGVTRHRFPWPAAWLPIRPLLCRMLLLAPQTLWKRVVLAHMGQWRRQETLANGKKQSLIS